METAEMTRHRQCAPFEYVYFLSSMWQGMHGIPRVARGYGFSCCKATPLCMGCKEKLLHVKRSPLHVREAPTCNIHRYLTNIFPKNNLQTKNIVNPASNPLTKQVKVSSFVSAGTV